MLTITGDLITADITEHLAVRVPPYPRRHDWAVSWLPGRSLTVAQAVVALTLAETAARHFDAYHATLEPAVVAWSRRLAVPSYAPARLANRRPTITEEAPKMRCPSVPPNKNCHFPLHDRPVARPFNLFTAADWAAYYREAAARLATEADALERTGTATDLMINELRITAHDCEIQANAIVEYTGPR